MSTLQDQLKQMGLVKPKVKGQNRKPKKQPKAAKKDRVKVSEETLRAQQAMIKKAKRDRVLNEQREAERKQKEIDAQVLQLVNHAKLDRENAEDSFNFTHKKKVKSIVVTPEQRRGLSKGTLAVVVTAGQRFEVVPKTAAQKLNERHSAAVVFLSKETTKESDKTKGQEDPYAAYEVPDDLIW
ncbi:MAG: DUF2058 domain-containing protein [Arenicella sp.]|jgi:uncharacterized protein YaiL (DUF2058 family)|nr:DUF2058 domain-containing protein [Arenicella sp.]